MKKKGSEKENPLNESAKGFVFARGMHWSETTKELMQDLARLKGEDARTTTGKNNFLPFEDEPALESLCRAKEAGLFAFANENKKRPKNIVFGRTFDGHILDMVELGVNKFESMQACQKRTKTAAASSYRAPLLLFQGEDFANAQEGSDIATVKDLFLDMFRGPPATLLDLEAIDLALVFTCHPNKSIQMRGYRITYEKPSGRGSPLIGLLPHGPNVDFEVRRFKAAAPNLAKLARRQPKLPGAGKTKNVSSDSLVGRVGQLHMNKQDMNKLVTRSRFAKVLKRKRGQVDDPARKKRTRDEDDF